jgi:hypothetical protein
MSHRNRWLTLAAAVALLFASGGTATAARLRFHYVPTDGCGNTALKPGGISGAAGERVSWFGSVREPYDYAPRPSYRVAFRHPYTGRTVTVPLALPEGTPRLEHVRNRIVFNYGSDTIEVRFLPDGSLDVIYNSGLLREP